MRTADEVISLLRDVSLLNRISPFREGNCLNLPGSGRLIVCGDIHGYRYAYERAVKYAALDKNPHTHIVFQEIIHGGPLSQTGADVSFELLFELAELKKRYPENVHIILANHDCSVITNSDVLKNGMEMNCAFIQGIKDAYQERWEDVLIAIKQFLFYLPLCARTESGLFISHSLPIPRFYDDFDDSIFERPLMIADFQRPSSVYSFTWGRKHSPESLVEMAERFGAKCFLIAHQKYPEGYLILPPNTVIIVSEHSNGCICELNLSEECSFAALGKGIKHLIDLY